MGQCTIAVKMTLSHILCRWLCSISTYLKYSYISLNFPINCSLKEYQIYLENREKCFQGLPKIFSDTFEYGGALYAGFKIR